MDVFYRLSHQTTPPKIGESLKDPLAMYLSDAYTVGFSLGQLPTLTVPKGTAQACKYQLQKIMTNKY